MESRDSEGHTSGLGLDLEVACNLSIHFQLSRTQSHDLTLTILGEGFFLDIQSTAYLHVSPGEKDSGLEKDKIQLLLHICSSFCFFCIKF